MNSFLNIRLVKVERHIFCVLLLPHGRRKINDTGKMEKIEENILFPPLYPFH